MANDRYVVKTVDCKYCETKQRVHIATSTGGAQMVDQTIQCIKCGNYFKVTVPDRIIRGPFPV
jgi:hypothetical protein